MFVPVFLLIALLILPFGGLSDTMGATDYDALAAMRGQYGIDLNAGQRAAWCIASRDTFGGVWLSDFRVNQFGMAEQTAP